MCSTEMQTYTATGLTPSTAYTLGIKTVGTHGLINATWVTNTSTTAPVVPGPGSPGKRHEPPQHHVPADNNHLELD